MKNIFAAASSLLLTLSIFLSISQNASAQSTGKTIWKITYGDEPVEISDVKVEGKDISFGKEFSAQSGWLGTLTFNVKNIGNKVINYVGITCLIQYLEARERPMPSFDMKAGFYYNAYRTVDKKNESIHLLPGQSISLQISEKQWRQFFATVGDIDTIQEPIKISLLISDVFVEDRTRWSMGCWQAMDTNDPTRWNLLRCTKPPALISSNTPSKAKLTSKLLSAKSTASKKAYDDKCYAPDMGMTYQCSASVNDCSPLFCNREVNRLKQDPMGY